MEIRLAVPTDAAEIAAIYAPAVVERATSFELVPPTAEKMAERITMIARRYPWLVAVDAEGVRGYAYASAHRDRPAYRWAVEVTAYVRADSHRRGIGRCLYEALFAVLALQGFRQAYAGIALPNHASVALHRAVGFRKVGVYRRVGYKLGQWHDVAWFGREIAPPIADPPPPRPLPEVVGEAGFRMALAVDEDAVDGGQ
ncbi:GNAT family N-acetyltransferase [soil metagenome]